jgi:quinol monooxygenase YgiN
MALTIVAQFQSRDGQTDALRAALTALVAPTRAEDGCEVYELHESVETAGFFHFHEIWTSRAHWDAHMRTAHLRAFGEVREGLVASARLFQLEKIA